LILGESGKEDKMPRKPQSTRTNTAARDEIFRRIDAEQRAALTLSQHFGIESQECAPPIDIVIMERLRAGLAIGPDLLSACFQRGLLSASLTESLYMVCFLSSTLPLARAAQSQTGVPASVLIAEAYEISRAYFDGISFEWKRAANDIFGTGKSFPSIGHAFMARAYDLANDSDFSAVLRAADNQAEYIKQLKRWSAPKYNTDLMNTFMSHSLVECDRIKHF
jgi:hypothetical protein